MEAKYQGRSEEEQGCMDFPGKENRRDLLDRLGPGEDGNIRD